MAASLGMMKHPMNWLLILATLLAPAFPILADGHTVEKTIDVNGVERDYLLHVPASYSREKPVPLVFSFHGGGGTSTVGERFTKFSGLSDREGFIVVYPNALYKNWNDGHNEPFLRS